MRKTDLHELKEHASNAADKAKKAAHKGKELYDDAKDMKQKGDQLKKEYDESGYSAVKMYTNRLKKKAKDKAKKFAKKGLKKGSKAAAKAAVHGLKAFVSFCLSNPLGWMVGGITIALLMAAFSAMGNASQPVTKTYDDNTTQTTDTGKMTQQDRNNYVAIMNGGCATSTSSPDGGVSMGGIGIGGSGLSQYKYSLSQVKKFAESGITSTWGVSVSKAEALFLTQQPGVAAVHGVNRSNIGKISQVVKNEGVSPIWFWLYATVEGGGAGGFINHYGESIGNAQADARRDAQYLKEVANSHAYPAAVEAASGINDNSKATPILKKLPDGSIGRAWTAATAAVTVEWTHLSGDHQYDSGPAQRFGPPLSQAMTYIKQMGGDPMKGDKAKASSTNGGGGDDGSATDSDGNNCNDKNDSAGLKDGGLTLKAAQSFMLKFYHTPLKPSDYAGAAAGSPDVHDNCTVFTAWFLNTYTKLHSVSGNGGEIVANLAQSNSELKVSHTPEAYSVFSIQGNKYYLAPGDAGHTGIVLGIDKKSGKAVIGEAEYGRPFTSVDSSGSGVNAIEVPLKDMTEANGWSFIHLNKYINYHGL